MCVPGLRSPDHSCLGHFSALDAMRWGRKGTDDDCRLEGGGPPSGIKMPGAPTPDGARKKCPRSGIDPWRKGGNRLTLHFLSAASTVPRGPASTGALAPWAHSQRITLSPGVRDSYCSPCLVCTFDSLVHALVEKKKTPEFNWWGLGKVCRREENSESPYRRGTYGSVHRVFLWLSLLIG